MTFKSYKNYCFYIHGKHTYKVYVLESTKDHIMFSGSTISAKKQVSFASYDIETELFIVLFNDNTKLAISMDFYLHSKHHDGLKAMYFAHNS
jgi:hypothetical protein